MKKKREQSAKKYYASTPKKNFSKKRDLENEIHGIYKQGNGNFGFVDIVTAEGEKKGYYVHETKKLDALEGDEVAFTIRVFRGKEEATITKVLKRSEQLIVGKLKLGSKFAFLIPETGNISKDIFIPGKFIGGYTDGSRVAVQVIKWEGKNPEGRIIESLESLPKGREDIYKIAFEMGARKSFSDSVMKYVTTLSKTISQDDISKRKDLRDILTYTIDGAESKDLDDAISILPLNEGEISEGQRGWKLYVHIADVTHYTQENSVLDREARKRGTSIYLCDQVIPMLPPEISNGLCSLNPNEDKLTFTCEMHISQKGFVTHSEVYESIICSDYRLTYKEVDEMTQEPQDTSIQLSPAKGKSELHKEKNEASSLLAGESGERCCVGRKQIGDELLFGKKISQELYNNIKLLKALTDILSKNTRERGSLDFDFPETKIILDDAGNPVEYKKYERYDSYKIIEECMVLANESVAKLFHKNPFLYRVHEAPDPEDVDKFMQLFSPQSGILSPLGEKEAAVREEIEQADFAKLLEILKKYPKLEPFQKLLLRSLTKARYSEKNLGHFGLALKYYSHFTSPIRRYPDLQIHRIIKEVIGPLSNSKSHTTPLSTLSGEERGNHKLQPLSPGRRKNGDRGVAGGKGLGLSLARKEHYQEILPKVAESSSTLSDRAEKMEYKVRDMMACKYMNGREGEIFIGKISGMIEKGFFVELENTIEGFIEFGFTGYHYDPEIQAVVNISTQKELHFGDEVQIALKSVDMSRYRLDFEMV